MIVGHGIDIVQIPRIALVLERFGERFAQRVFTEGERARAEASPHPAASYAKRFAAKEAFGKALGEASGIGWREIEVVRDAAGKPSLVLHGAAQARLQGLRDSGRMACHLSLSDDAPLAMASVILEWYP